MDGIRLDNCLLRNSPTTIPTINGYNYIGTVDEIGFTENGIDIRLNNDETFIIHETVGLGDFIYQDRYGQLKVINPGK